MRSRELAELGLPQGKARRLASRAVQTARRAGANKQEARSRLLEVIETPADYTEDPVFGELAVLLSGRTVPGSSFAPRDAPAPYATWGDDLDAQSIQQMKNACDLPVTVRGAIMPDAHVGYGLPIGGVLATRNTVIPYAVGVDIACRMKLTVLDLPVTALKTQPDRLKRAIERETRFGIGSEFKGVRRAHPVMDEDWDVTALTARLKDKAWRQLGTSGSGNHFVEFGVLSLDKSDLGLEVGQYLALLSHSGSRGAGATVCQHYSRLAMNLHPGLPGYLRHLAWLSLDRAEGREYWAAMQLMGLYAAANHACIHRHIARHLGAQVLADVENHHNFAWLEEHDGDLVVVHRKGATPAAAGDLGVIPGSMAAPAFVVRGKGNPEALRSAAHGAGRVMSRKAAKKRFRWADVRQLLEKKGVELMSAGLDEVPGVYKDIHTVMAAQSDLVEIVARFDPRLVKMAPGGRAED